MSAVNILKYLTNVLQQNGYEEIYSNTIEIPDFKHHVYTELLVTIFLKKFDNGVPLRIIVMNADSVNISISVIKEFDTYTHPQRYIKTFTVLDKKDVDRFIEKLKEIEKSIPEPPIPFGLQLLFKHSKI